MIRAIVWFYVGGIVAVFPFAYQAAVDGLTSDIILKDLLFWPGLYRAFL